MLARTGYAILAVASLVIWFGMQPESNSFDTARFDERLVAARLDNSANDSRADSAPQQQVVNGWIARDLLEIQVEQLNAIGDADDVNDDRTSALIVVLVLSVCWLGLTTQLDRRDRAAAAAD